MERTTPGKRDGRRISPDHADAGSVPVWLLALLMAVGTLSPLWNEYHHNRTSLSAAELGRDAAIRVAEINRAASIRVAEINAAATRPPRLAASVRPPPVHQFGSPGGGRRTTSGTRDPNLAASSRIASSNNARRASSAVAHSRSISSSARSSWWQWPTPSPHAEHKGASHSQHHQT